MLPDLLRGKWLLGSGEWMVWPDHEDKLNAAYGFDRQQAFRRRAPRRPNHHVGATANEGVPATAQHFSTQPDARAGLLAVKILQKRKQALDWHQVIHGDAQLAFPSGGNVFHATFQIGCSTQ